MIGVKNMTWVQTYTGIKFTPFNPSIEDINIIDIAHSLSMQCRFNGHCDDFYSVAEHSFWMSYHTENALDGLMHDSAEAYLRDLVRPLKSQIHQYQHYEDNILKLIYEKWDIKKGGDTKYIDNCILLTEKDQLMKVEPDDWKITGGKAKH